MTRCSLRAMVLGTALIAAAPVLAQAVPAPAGAGMTAGPKSGMRHGGPGMMDSGMMGPDRAFASMSEAGRKTMRESMGSPDDRKADHEAVKAARDRMLTILDADKLDTGALRRSMDDERKLATASHDRRQAAMLAGFSKLSAADRKAFVADSRAMKTRMETRMEAWRKRGGPRGMGGRDGDMPPPPPPGF